MKDNITVKENKTQHNIVSLFDSFGIKTENIKTLLETIKFDKVSAVTPFQISNFIINEREFPTSLMKYRQTKLEIFTRINNFIDNYYLVEEAKANILMSEGEIEEIAKNEKNQKIKEAKIKLKEINIEKNLLKIDSISNILREKLDEILIFYDIYSKNKFVDALNKEEIEKLDQEGWQIKSEYYEELQMRYNLTPTGFLKYPHQIKQEL